MQIIKGGSLASSLGENLGTGVGEGLQHLLDMKMKDMERSRSDQREAHALMGIGMPREKADMLVGLDPKSKELVIKNFLASSSGAGGQQENGLGSLGGQPPEQQQQLQQLLSQLVNPQQQTPGQMSGAMMSQLLNPQSQQMGLDQAQQPLDLQSLQPFLEPQAQQAAQPREKTFEERLKGPTGISVENKLKIEKLKADKELAAKKLSIEEKNRQQKILEHAFEKTDATRKDVITKAESAKKKIADIKEMKRMQDAGELDSPAKYTFLKGLGLDIPALMKPGSQAFEKIRQGFMRDAKEAVGANVTTKELEMFMKTIPSLAQSKEGMEMIFNNLFEIYGLDELKAEEMKSLIKKKKGVPPLDLREKLDNKMRKSSFEFSKKFKEDIRKAQKNKSVLSKMTDWTDKWLFDPGRQNELEIAASAIAGNILGSPGKLIGGVSRLFAGGA